MNSALQPQSPPRLTLGQILQMNVGFLGLQFSFGLQQSSMSPIYSYLGADEASLPLLFLAGPMTGLLVQPIVGAMSDKTTSSFGRRTPYFLVGAILCSLALFAMPYSTSLWMAASLLWILDAANNITMEPYRAYVGDRLPKEQHPTGYIMQSAFTGLAQTLSYLTPSILVWLGMNKDALASNDIPEITLLTFAIGAVVSITTIVWSIWRVPELPLTPQQLSDMQTKKGGALSTLKEIGQAIKEMPLAMRQMAWMKLFQWYAMGCYWQYVLYSLSRSLFHTADASTQGFRDAVLVNGQVGAFYNLVAFVAALVMVPFTRKLGAGRVHAFCLTVSGLGMMAIPQMSSEAGLFLPAIGVGMGWASIMGNPYVMLASSVPPERTGVYMGIFNMMIVIPLLLVAATMPLVYDTWLQGDPRNVMVLAGVLMLFGALATLRVQVPKADTTTAL